MLSVRSAIRILIIILATNAIADNNTALTYCLNQYDYDQKNFDTFNWNLTAGCFSDYQSWKKEEDLKEMRDFLKHNPRYRFPGQSLNKCFGKPREMPFENAYIEKDGNGFRAGITYKDKLPTGCYENAPWDNRDLKEK